MKTADVDKIILNHENEAKVKGHDTGGYFASR